MTNHPFPFSPHSAVTSIRISTITPPCCYAATSSYKAIVVPLSRSVSTSSNEVPRYLIASIEVLA
ncbi:hypothetical protein TIFTF001_053898 [Ficus carica]|uniref:Uncharacterized protein n=1 Tax=Ficus carica TaxID=3494 RepID=A0AA88EH29_FICCA|nr:hypothetical protein TIFTF001_053892 [Ficus carica]GMN74674.1 hypothetical protein TIFTF001_053893 [Ficus carica]GMN74682.1 hypothetical protein TIFTF001_053897 [Ficus carica]GMN74688.1 hypothetical protein TIFTF001_053898 [Ficus carica]